MFLIQEALSGKKGFAFPNSVISMVRTVLEELSWMPFRCFR